MTTRGAANAQWGPVTIRYEVVMMRLGLALISVLTACAPASATPPPASGAAPGGAVPLASAAAAGDTARITVTGSGEVRLAADRARIRVAVETEAGTAAEAGRANADGMSRVVEALRSRMAGQDRLETEGYQLQPVYTQDRTSPDGRRIAGYRALNHVLVVTADLDGVGRILDASLEAGANRIAELSFFAAETEPARLEAIRRATRTARAEAQAVADELGMILSTPESIQISGGGSWGPVRMMAMESARADTPVEPGTQAVQASVTLTYRLLEAASR